MGLVAAAVVAAVARRSHALSIGGAAAAVALGTVAVGAGWSWGAVLLAYFVTSTLLTRFRAATKLERTDGRVAKPGPRDAEQVAANGGVFGAAALGYWMNADPLWQPLAAGALAASAADTWATELGTLARTEARSIIAWHPVPTGTSGGVTPQGFLAAAAGAGFVALACWAVGWPLVTVVSALAGGFFGAVMDSVIGATIQARRHCPTCNVLTEQAVHRCGTPTAVVGGIAWLDNDGVNSIATLYGALFGTVAATFL
jgi:uncharacterized protein (TIGR00297 family)